MMSSTTLEAVKFFKNSWAFAWVVIISIVINIIFGLLLVDEFIIVGVSISSISSQFVIFLLANYALYKEIGFLQKGFFSELLIGLMITFGLISTGFLINSEKYEIYYFIVPSIIIIFTYIIMIYEIRKKKAIDLKIN